MTTEGGHAEERYKAGFGPDEKPLDSVRFPHVPGGHGYPHYYPQPDETLGEPLSIREAAQLLGCSPWTVRHSYLPKGLPHLRSGPLGKLTFYRTQVVRWILQHQRKGGM
jgi:hypothetical protein